MKNIIKFSLLVIFVVNINAIEFQKGNGTFEMKGGFLGLNNTIKSDIKTISLIEQHENLFSTNWFYKYNITYYKSDKLLQKQNTISTYTSGFFNQISSQISPQINYEFEGLDINLVLGRDLFHKNDDDYLGVGIMIGASVPWIESKKDEDNDDSSSDTTMNNMQDSKTKLSTYKIGPSLAYRIKLNNVFSIYASGTYAYQTASVQNDYANTKITANGIFQEYDFGLRFQPFSYKKDFGWITISPRFFATVGYRYTSWKLDDINIDITGTNTNFTSINFSMKSKVTYFGLGYSF